MEMEVVKIVGSMFLTYGAHYGISKFYNEFCIPNGVYGFFQGLLNAGSPTCSVALKYMTISQDSYATMITMGISRMFLDVLIKK
jgi:hypothetical protein